MADKRRSADLDHNGDSSGDPSRREAAGAGQQQFRVVLDDSSVEPIYANLCLASSTSEEVILDFAMNPTPLGDQNRKLEISQRVIMTHWTAKRLAQLLVTTVQRHEAMFGPLETDIRKRMQSAATNED